jgi:hypothetical protein
LVNKLISIVDLAKNILSKENRITLKDYKKFCLLRKKAKSKEDKEKFMWLSEGMYQLLPAIASKEGNYNFLEEEDK